MLRVRILLTMDDSKLKNEENETKQTYQTKTKWPLINSENMKPIKHEIMLEQKKSARNPRRMYCWNQSLNTKS